MIDSLQIDTSDSPKVLKGRFTEPSSKFEIVLPEGWKGMQSPRFSAGESPYTSGVFVIPEGLDLTRIVNGASSDFYAMFILTGNLEELLMTTSDDAESCKSSSDILIRKRL
jgi:hypothetical protein